MDTNIADKPKHPGGRPLKFKSPEELQALIDQYFNSCDQTIIKTLYSKDGNIVATIPKPYTVTGLACFLNTDRQTLINYENKDQFFDAIKNAKAKIEDQLEAKTLSGDYTPAMAIFSLKNNFKWVDKQEVAHTGADGQPLTVIVHRGSDLTALPEPVERIENAQVIDTQELDSD